MKVIPYYSLLLVLPSDKKDREAIRERAFRKLGLKDGLEKGLKGDLLGRVKLPSAGEEFVESLNDLKKVLKEREESVFAESDFQPLFPLYKTYGDFCRFLSIPIVSDLRLKDFVTKNFYNLKTMTLFTISLLKAYSLQRVLGDEFGYVENNDGMGDMEHRDFLEEQLRAFIELLARLSFKMVAEYRKGPSGVEKGSEVWEFINRYKPLVGKRKSIPEMGYKALSDVMGGGLGLWVGKVMGGDMWNNIHRYVTHLMKSRGMPNAPVPPYLSIETLPYSIYGYVLFFPDFVEGSLQDIEGAFHLTTKNLHGAFENFLKELESPPGKEGEIEEINLSGEWSFTLPWHVEKE